MTRALWLLPWLAAPSTLLAQGASPFDPARVTARSDSFVVTVQGRPVGGIRETIEQTTSGFRLISTQVLAGMRQATEVHFTRRLVMTSVRQDGEVRGQQMKIAVTYAGGRARGSATTPGPQGMTTVVVDTVVEAGAVDDNALQSLLPALPIADGRQFSIPVFASGQGTSKTMTVRVAGQERITVPAGAFDTWKLEVTGGQVPVVFWVDRVQPRVVKMGFSGAPMAFELVR